MSVRARPCSGDGSASPQRWPPASKTNGSHASTSGSIGWTMTPHRNPSSMTTSSGSSGAGMSARRESSSANSASLRSWSAAAMAPRDGGSDSGWLIAGATRRSSIGEPGGDAPAHLGQLGRQAVLELAEQFVVQREFARPRVAVDAADERVTSRVEVEARPVEVAVARRHAERVRLAGGRTLDALDDPAQHAHVLAVAGPDELAVGTLPEPVDAEDLRQLRARAGQDSAEVEPVLEVLAHVVAHERQHRERVAPDDALRAGGGGGRLRAHRRGHVDALGPVARLADERDRGRTPAAEDEGVDRHAARR